MAIIDIRNCVMQDTGLPIHRAGVLEIRQPSAIQKSMTWTCTADSEKMPALTDHVRQISKMAKLSVVCVVTLPLLGLFGCEPQTAQELKPKSEQTKSVSDSAIVSDAQLMSIVKQIAAGADEQSDSWRALNAISRDELGPRLQRIQRALPAENRERVSLAFVLCLLSYEYENNKDIILLDFSKEPHQKNSNADWEAELIHRLIVRGDTRLLPVLFEAVMWADGALAASLSGYLTYHLQNSSEQFLLELRPKSYAIRRGVYGYILSNELLRQEDLHSIMRYVESVPRSSASFEVAQEMRVILRKGLRH